MTRNARIATPFPRLTIGLRIVCATLGGWAFSWGLVACGTAALAGLGLSFHDAEAVMQMLGLLSLLGILLWSIAGASVLRIVGGLAIGATLLNLGAWLLQRALLA
ncbi:MAG: iron uptake protein [Burkholderiales bacterium PBB6]|nr:MAG: iron uptake protein [Burkholderiales bacterium PBB6]